LVCAVALHRKADAAWAGPFPRFVRAAYLRVGELFPDRDAFPAKLFAATTIAKLITLSHECAIYACTITDSEQAWVIAGIFWGMRSMGGGRTARFGVPANNVREPTLASVVLDSQSPRRDPALRALMSDSCTSVPAPACWDLQRAHVTAIDIRSTRMGAKQCTADRISSPAAQTRV
jgi:hypothetical protein